MTDRKSLILILVFILGAHMTLGSLENPVFAENVRPSPLAGAWYPGDAGSLQKMLNKYLATATPPQSNNQVRALISPHAGYVYSGKAAACGFKAVEGKPYTRVIIIGPSHYVHFHGIGVSSYDAYETPLGTVPVDKTVTSKLSQHPLFQYQPSAESREHSLEMQIPFLQIVLNDFSIVPLVVGDLREPEYAQVVEQLQPCITKHTLVIVSTDFSHYGRRFEFVPFTDNVKENLRALDLGSVDYILSKDFSGFNTYVKKTGITICGRRPVGLLIKLLPVHTSGELLSYYTSADLMNDYSSAVSYCSIVFYEAKGSDRMSPPSPKPSSSSQP
jgi:AmmeMemoRadiSam system protein B